MAPDTVKYVGNIDVVAKAQQTHAIILDAIGAHIMREDLVFPCEKSGSYLQDNRLTPGTVGAKPRTNRVLASQISNPLSSCVPPFSESVPNVPSIPSFSSTSNIPATDTAYDDLLEPIPSPPLCSVLEGIEFERKPPFESECYLGVAALNPGLLKHGKVVDISPLHVSLAHAHASVLQATARQHSFRLTGELVSFSACSMVKRNPVTTAQYTTADQEADGDSTQPYLGSFPASLGESRYVVMLVDGASRLQRPHGTRDKSATIILAAVKRLVADRGVP